MQNATTLWETAWKFLIKLNIHSPYDPAIPLDIYPREIKTYVHTKSCSWMFIVALFIIAKNWKQPKYPSTGEQINKQWNNTQKYKGTDVHSNTDDSKCITPRERRPMWKATFHVIPLNDILIKTRHRGRKQVSGCQGLGVEKEVTRKESGGVSVGKKKCP